ncbi:DUF6541 family protein [Actinomyces procaprae]|uniref:DUF6541 family protein n=1 Tax=Actinomyces procaprae TaxID=2560010 RepID=UPI0010A28E4D|nr:DUF6541 family protein [Actinomyces procaprae]
MTAWAALVLAAVGISLLILVPGALALVGAGADRAVALAAGATVTVACAGAAAVALSRLGIPWDARTAGALLVAMGGAGAIAGVLRRRWRRTTAAGRHGAGAAGGTAHGRRAVAASIVGAVTAGGVQAGLFAKVTGTPRALLQNNDAMVQLNLIEEIRRSADASTLTAAIPITGGSYPTVWHSFSVFLTPFAGTPFVFNAMVVSLFAVLYPAGMAMLAAAAGGGPAARLSAPWLGLAACWFPGSMLTFNAQASGSFAIALIPAALAAVVLLWREAFNWHSLLLGAVIVLGLAIASPGAGQWAVLVACVLLFVRLLPRVRAAGGAGLRRASMTLGLAVLAALPVLMMPAVPRLMAMGSFPRGEGPLWPRLLTPLLLNDPTVSTWPVATPVLSYLPLSLLGIAGAVLTRRRGDRVLTGALAVTVACVWITILPEGRWWALVGGWWRDYPRYLAVEVICLAATGAIALDVAIAWAQRRLVRAQPGPPARRARAAAIWLVAVVLVAAVCVPNLGTFRQLTARGYVVLVHPPWVTEQEARRMEAVGAGLPEDAVVYGFPQTGAGLIPVLTPANSVHRSWSPTGTWDERFIAEHFDEFGTDPRVCEAVRRIGGTPYYYDDSDIADLERWMYFPGYDQVDLDAGFELVATLDSARLYRVTACD